jgi:hypothetical protein
MKSVAKSVQFRGTGVTAVTSLVLAFAVDQNFVNGVDTF